MSRNREGGTGQEWFHILPPSDHTDSKDAGNETDIMGGNYAVNIMEIMAPFVG